MFQNGKWRIREPENGHLFGAVFAGDVCPGEVGEKVCREGRAVEVFAEVKDFIAKGDLKLVQWETPLAVKENPIPKSGPNLNSAPETVEIATSAGFDVALLANNHTVDHGTENAMETIRILQKTGLATVGAGENLEQANKPLKTERAGKKIAILNFAEHEFGIAGTHTPGTAPINPVSNLKAVRDAAAENDFVIVALHGGHEMNPYPSPRMVEFFRALADAGASVVFNCHTHCPEGIEFHNGTPIIYSPGNFYFPKLVSRLPVWRTGYLTLCRFDSKGVYELELCPYIFELERVVPLSGKDEESFYEYMKKLCVPLSNPELLNRLFENWSMKVGFNYLAGVFKSLPEDWWQKYGEPKIAAGMLGLRNLFTCEAHQDIVRTFLYLVEEGRTESARDLLAEIEAFQRPEWVINKEA